MKGLIFARNTMVNAILFSKSGAVFTNTRALTDFPQYIAVHVEGREGRGALLSIAKHVQIIRGEKWTVNLEGEC